MTTQHHLKTPLWLACKPLIHVLPSCTVEPPKVRRAFLAWGEDDDEPPAIGWIVSGKGVIDGEVVEIESEELWPTEAEALAALQAAEEARQ